MKLCECGCGEPAPIATYNAVRRGYVKGQPVRFISGHNTRVRPIIPATYAKVSAALTGRYRGENSPSWRGGTHLQRGRKKVYVGRDHPMADLGGYVFEYRMVAAAALGRFLRPDEHVHHIDGDETNNAPENLVVLTRRQHKRAHWLIARGTDPRKAVEEVSQW